MQLGSFEYKAQYYFLVKCNGYLFMLPIMNSHRPPEMHPEFPRRGRQPQRAKLRPNLENSQKVLIKP